MSNQPTKSEKLRAICNRQSLLIHSLQKFKEFLIGTGFLKDVAFYAHSDGCFTVIQMTTKGLSLSHFDWPAMKKLYEDLQGETTNARSILLTALEDNRAAFIDHTWTDLFDTDIANKSDPLFMYKDALVKSGLSPNMTLIAKLD